MTTNEVELQLAQFRRLNTDVGKLSETCVHTVDSATCSNDLLNHLPRFFSARSCVFRESYLLPSVSHIRYLLES